MLRSMIKRYIARFERRYGYDATYMREVVDTSVPAFLKFALMQGMNLHREGVPKEAWHAARVASARHEDCGPCTQLVVDMALEDGVPPATLRAVVARDFTTMPADAALGLRLAEATLAQAPADELRAEARRRYGDAGLLSLAFGIATTRIFPTMKRVLGHAHTCERVKVQGEVVAAARANEERAAA